MKPIKYLLFLVLMGCSVSKVIVDYDDITDFYQYRTFDFYEDNGDNLNDFDVKRITNAIQQKLEKANLNQDSKPDFFIYFDTETAPAQNNNTIGVGIGTGGIGGGIGVSGGIPIGGKKLNEKLIIKFIAAESNSLVWEGILSSTIKEKRTPVERELFLQEVVQEILSSYPPKKKK